MTGKDCHDIFDFLKASYETCTECCFVKEKLYVNTYAYARANTHIPIYALRANVKMLINSESGANG